MNRDDKLAVVSELNESFNRAKFAVVADYCGLKVSELQKIRIELKNCRFGNPCSQEYSPEKSSYRYRQCRFE